MDTNKKRVSVTKDSFKGRPVVVVQFEGDSKPFRFGSGKARRLLGAPAKALKQVMEAVVSEAEALDAAAGQN